LVFRCNDVQAIKGEYPFGVYLDAAVNVKTKNRMDWPKFMTSNPQYQNLIIRITKNNR
jgi:serine/threonine-protein kinase